MVIHLSSPLSRDQTQPCWSQGKQVDRVIFSTLLISAKTSWSGTLWLHGFVIWYLFGLREIKLAWNCPSNSYSENESHIKIRTHGLETMLDRYARSKTFIFVCRIRLDKRCRYGVSASLVASKHGSVPWHGKLHDMIKHIFKSERLAWKPNWTDMCGPSLYQKQVKIS